MSIASAGHPNHGGPALAAETKQGDGFFALAGPTLHPGHSATFRHEHCSLFTQLYSKGDYDEYGLATLSRVIRDRWHARTAGHWHRAADLGAPDPSAAANGRLDPLRHWSAQ